MTRRAVGLPGGMAPAATVAVTALLYDIKAGDVGQESTARMAAIAAALVREGAGAMERVRAGPGRPQGVL
ncbi:MAG TPA: hypothetical protein VF495_25460 [Phenylobacterium sp.]